MKPALAPRSVQVSVSKDDQISAQKLSELNTVSDADLDQYLGAVHKLQGKSKIGRVVPTLLSGVTRPPRPRSPEAEAYVSAASEKLQQKVAGAALDLGRIYADGLVSENELHALQHLGGRIDAVLTMRDEGALAMIAPDVRKRLDDNLFGPLRALRDTAQKYAATGALQVIDRDEAALPKILAAPVTFTKRDVAAVYGKRESIAGLDRYQRGDRVAVPRSSGKVELGVVTGNEDDGLHVALPSPQGMLTKILSAEAVAAANPLKIGDVLECPEHDVWVTGVDEQGQMVGVRQNRGTGEVTRMTTQDLRDLAQSFAAAAQHTTTVSADAPAPIENGVAVVAGGMETGQHIDTLRSRTMQGGLYTTRGPTLEAHGVNYANYNEDGALLGVLRDTNGKEVVTAGAFDQAGGMGKIEGHTGAASEIAARSFRDAAEQVAHGADPRQALNSAVRSAHAKIVAMNEAHGLAHNPSITTAAGGVVRDGVAHVVNTGDSKVWHFSADGRLKNETASHNMCDVLSASSGDPNAGLGHANIVTECLGVADRAPEIDYYAWPLAKGDYLVFGSDGIADANLKAQKQEGNWRRHNGAVTNVHLGAIISRSRDAEQATLQIRDYALGQMASGRAKPDNTTVVVLQAR